MSAAFPRVVVVTRDTAYEQLLARHATHAQAAFFLSTRGRSIDAPKAEHDRFCAALQRVSVAIPARWRQTRVRRDDLERFVFEPEDIVVAVGQDGLVANVAKYLAGQPVVGINPDRERYDGVLVPFPAEALRDVLPLVARGRAELQRRTMVCAVLDDGQRLLALNEIFVGVQTHQSARYQIRLGERQEQQSSSGLIVATGTGATGWARSIHRERRSSLALPDPTEGTLVFFVREAFPSVSTQTDLTEGLLPGRPPLEVTSQNQDRGVIFGDGIEDDYLPFAWGQTVRITAAPQTLNLVWSPR